MPLIDDDEEPSVPDPPSPGVASSPQATTKRTRQEPNEAMRMREQ